MREFLKFFYEGLVRAQMKRAQRYLDMRGS